MMNGLIYKNLKQNRLYIILSAVVALICVPLILLMAVTDENNESVIVSINDTHLIRLFFTIAAEYVLFSMHSMTLKCDESKKWAFFVASSPKGARGQVFSRYAILLLMNVITTAVITLVELGIGALVKFSANEEPKLNIKFFLIAAFIVMFLDALEIPFYFRFGCKYGNVVQTISFFGIILAAMVYLLFGPLPENMDGLVEGLFNFVNDFREGKTPHALKVFCIVFPFAAVGAFIGSYFISYRLYLKGTDNYEK